jgi:hypothetical protein
MEPIQKYKPQYAKIVPWEKIEERFTDLSESGSVLECMLALVKFIRNNGYANRLYEYTSMHKLIVTIYDPAEWNRESLHIEIYHNSRQWYFQYFSHFEKLSEVQRSYPEDRVSRNSFSLWNGLNGKKLLPLLLMTATPTYHALSPTNGTNLKVSSTCSS